MSLTFASNLTKMIDAGLGGEVIAPDTSVAIGYRMQYHMVSGPVASWNDPEGGLPINIVAAIEPIQSGTGDPSPENIRPISGRTAVNIWRDAEHNTSADPTITIQLGQTVYGGRLNVTSGVLTVDRAMVDMGTLAWSYGAQYNTFMSTNHKEMKFNSIPVCSQYKGYSDIAIVNLPNFGILIGNSQAYPIVRVKDIRYTDAATFKTDMSGVQLVYELAQPLTITLTPQTINSMLGQNNVWSDAGDVSVTWKEKLYTEGY